MQLALDNETAAATYWKGLADPTPHGLIGVDGFYIPFEEWDEEVKQWFRYDPEAAEKLLDEAGYQRGADGTRFKTTVNYGAWADLDYTEIAAAYWAQIGVEVEIDALTSAEYHERLFGRTGEGMYSAIAGNKFDPVLAAPTVEEQQRLIAEADKYAMSRHWLIWVPKSPVFFLAQPWSGGGEANRQAACNHRARCSGNPHRSGDRPPRRHLFGDAPGHGRRCSGFLSPKTRWRISAC